MKTVFVAGIFDMLHKGHLELLRKMREMGDQTIVVLHNDMSCFKIKDKFPVQYFNHRKRNLELTGLVDEVVRTDYQDPAPQFFGIIERFPGATYVRGDDLTEDFPGRWALDKEDVTIVFKPYTKGVSSTKIRDSL